MLTCRQAIARTGKHTIRQVVGRQTYTQTQGDIDTHASWQAGKSLVVLVGWHGEVRPRHACWCHQPDSGTNLPLAASTAGLASATGRGVITFPLLVHPATQSTLPPVCAAALALCIIRHHNGKDVQVGDTRATQATAVVRLVGGEGRLVSACSSSIVRWSRPCYHHCYATKHTPPPCPNTDASGSTHAHTLVTPLPHTAAHTRTPPSSWR
ncbi:hypothetical protein Pcinc_041865 [Petrolisthes cinctipes]|uniref:Uncharacterized protein n=1 Tax=Petrolisthes cinctipes TaxID=88211 RepID=A0AAE1EHX4_PETCI|nr:hypothetical protein Pcinc_041865 [Petrolisthes cinctipes]